MGVAGRKARIETKIKAAFKITRDAVEAGASVAAVSSTGNQSAMVQNAGGESFNAASVMAPAAGGFPGGSPEMTTYYDPIPRVIGEEIELACLSIRLTGQAVGYILGYCAVGPVAGACYIPSFGFFGVKPY